MVSSPACTTDGGDEGSGEASDGESMADGANCEPQPTDGVLYASCRGAACNTGLVCAYNEELGQAASPAYCTGYCTFSEQCEVVGLCTAEPMCIIPSNGNTGVCVLDCSDGKQCPEGMECLQDEDGGAIRYLCY